jgi:hypothetical protein
MSKTYVIDNNEARLPFLGDKMSFVTGLDPLGLQNPSGQMYSYLLSGLNNVTAHIRNYSFYCWLLDEYAQRIKSTDPEEQKTFIRKAEYILALVAYHAQIEGVSGSLFVKRLVDDGVILFILREGIYNKDGKTSNTYWQFPFGVFGQYYVGSLRQIGLIDEPKNDSGEPLGIYRRTGEVDNLTVSGSDLAKAFKQNISEEGKNLFFVCMDAGQVSTDQLEQLRSDFILTRIDQDSEEAKLLFKLLNDVDEPPLHSEYPSYWRNLSIQRVLDFTRKAEQVNERLFTMGSYDRKGIRNGEFDDTLTGWYFYQLNEYWQFTCTAIFNGLLNLLEHESGPNWMSVDDLIEKASELCDRELGKTSYLRLRIDESERDIYEIMRRANFNDRIIWGFKLISKLYQNNAKELDRLKVFIEEKQIGSDYDAVHYFHRLASQSDLPVIDFVKSFLRINILNRHRYVAYRKMGGGYQSTEKFMMENGFIRKIDNFDPGFTAPRLGNLMRFLEVLGYIDADWKLTTKGSNYLKEFES